MDIERTFTEAIAIELTPATPFSTAYEYHLKYGYIVRYTTRKTRKQYNQWVKENG